MPNLPTLTVTDDQAARLLAIFGDAAGYRAWLRDALKSYVMDQERHRVDRAAQEAREAEIEQIESELFGEVTP